jgi:hypothetical protein
MFGSDDHSRHGMRSGHVGHGEFGEQVILDVSEPLRRLVELGDIKNELQVTLVPAGVPKSPNERFTFSPRANPQIGAVILKIEKDE